MIRSRCNHLPNMGGNHGQRKVTVCGTVWEATVRVDHEGSPDPALDMATGDTEIRYAGAASRGVSSRYADLCFRGQNVILRIDGPCCVVIPSHHEGTWWEQMDSDRLRAFFGGRLSCRITVPMIDNDGIALAADTLEKLSHDLRKISGSREKKLTKLLAARQAIVSAHKRLKVDGIVTDGRPTLLSADEIWARKRLGATNLRTVEK
jgi:hypothetical protein